jgi:hypothetical protein
VTSGVPSRAFSEATRTWQAIASSQPPPRANPLTAAITGLPIASIRASTRCPRSVCSRPSMGPRAESSAMSAPATNAFSPAPVRMTPRTEASAAMAVNTWSSSSITRALIAFSFSGRLTTTTATPSVVSTLSVS